MHVRYAHYMGRPLTVHKQTNIAHGHWRMRVYKECTNKKKQPSCLHEKWTLFKIFNQSNCKKGTLLYTLHITSKDVFEHRP